MRSITFPLLLLGLLSPGGAVSPSRLQPAPPEQTPALTVTIAVPKLNGQRIVDLSTADPHIDVVIRNTSRRPLNLFGEDNSVGYNNLHLELLAIDGKPLPQPILVNRVVEAWYRNVIQTVTLDPGEAMVREVHFTKDEPMQGVHYQNFPPMKPGDQHKIRLRAVFEYPGDLGRFQLHFHRVHAARIMPSAATKSQPDTWTGRCVSATDDYQFNQYSP